MPSSRCGNAFHDSIKKGLTAFQNQLVLFVICQTLGPLSAYRSTPRREPFTTGRKRGLDTKVSLKQAFVTERHGIEWEDKGTHSKHLSVLDYKKKQRAKEVVALQTVKTEK